MAVDFNQMRLGAMLTIDGDPLRKDVEEEMWSDFGRQIHRFLMDERFIKAINTAIMQWGHEPAGVTPQVHLASRLRSYLLTGAITK